MVYSAAGVLTPYFVAGRRHEKTGHRFFYLYRFSEVVFYPVIFLVECLTRALSALFSVDIREDTQDVTEEDVISLSSTTRTPRIS